MKALLAGVALTLGASLAGCAHREIVGYYAGWKPGTTVRPGDATVLDYAFATLSPQGAVELDGSAAGNDAFGRFRALKRADPGLRLMVSVGGWSRSGTFSGVAADAAKRAVFVESTIALLRRQGLDGIDIDWEYPGDIGDRCPPGESCERADDKRNFILLARELRTALDAAGRSDDKRYLATIAAGADAKFLGDEAGSEGWLRELSASLDWINLMSYDYHGSWERVAGLNAPLWHDPADPDGRHVEASVKRLLASGIPAHKVTLGMPFYGKGWAGCAPGPARDGLYQPCAGLAAGSAGESFDFAYLTDRGYLARDAAGRYTEAGLGFVRHWNAAASVPYLYNAANGIFITYDDEASIARKADLVRAYGLRGAMYWEIGADDHGVLRAVLSGALRRGPSGQ
jgi:chitinase